MEKLRSYVTFKDGHEEEIVYFKKYGENKILFTTKSGVYEYNRAIIPLGVCGLSRSYEFFVLVDDASESEPRFIVDPYIKSITIDERVPYKYHIYGTGYCISGKILAAPDSDEETMHKLILEDVHIEYWKEDDDYGDDVCLSE